jgi:hypothetical protein
VSVLFGKQSWDLGKAQHVPPPSAAATTHRKQNIPVVSVNTVDIRISSHAVPLYAPHVLGESWFCESEANAEARVREKNKTVANT